VVSSLPGDFGKVGVVSARVVPLLLGWCLFCLRCCFAGLKSFRVFSHEVVPVLPESCLFPRGGVLVAGVICVSVGGVFSAGVMSFLLG
jgi:hypothetical protein